MSGADLGAGMSGWKAKRFWKEAQVVQAGDGWSVTLDGRPVKTPAKAGFVVPTRAMAEAAAQEWQAQSGEIRPETMPITRAANSAIDKVAAQFAEVAAIVAAYGETDLLCYRATGPEALCQRQAQAWDPLLEWAARQYDAPLRVASGVLPVAQDAACLSRLTEAVTACSTYELVALHDLVAISGSLVLGLAVCNGRLSPDEAWAISRIDEHWQVEQWGEDEEATKFETIKRADFDQAARFFKMARPLA